MLELKVVHGGSEVTLQFEHSLLALSKWESKFKKPFLQNSNRMSSELLEYFQCMIVTPDVDPNLVYVLTPQQFEEILNYINDPCSASKFPTDDAKSKASNEVLTSDIIYYQLAALRIPFEPVERWHLYRLQMLISITADRQQPPKKQNRAQQLAKWREMSQKNRERFGSKG